MAVPENGNRTSTKNWRLETNTKKGHSRSGGHQSSNLSQSFLSSVARPLMGKLEAPGGRKVQVLGTVETRLTEHAGVITTVVHDTECPHAPRLKNRKYYSRITCRDSTEPMRAKC
jgi:hypothetical protein